MTLRPIHFILIGGILLLILYQLKREPNETVEVAEIAIDGDFELGLLPGIPMDIFEKRYDSLVINGVLSNEHAFIQFGTYKPQRSNIFFRTSNGALRLVKWTYFTESPSAFLMSKKDEYENKYGTPKVNTRRTGGNTFMKCV